MSAVVDASLLVAAVCDGGTEGLWAEDVVGSGAIVAPHLVLAEAANILRRLEMSGKLERGEAASAFYDLLELDLELAPSIHLPAGSGNCGPV